MSGYHGEQLDVPVVYNTTDKMVDVLNDVHSENTNNKHSMNIDETLEPTEGPSATNDGIDKLALAETELYPGCTSMSSSDFLAKMSHVKVTNNWTDSSFDQLLKLLKYSFPKDNKIPSSHVEAKKMMKKSG